MAGPLLGVSEGPAKPRTYGCCSLNQDRPRINPTWFIGRASSREEARISLQRSGGDRACRIAGQQRGMFSRLPRQGNLKSLAERKLMKAGACSATLRSGCWLRAWRRENPPGRPTAHHPPPCKKTRGRCKFEAYLRGPLPDHAVIAAGRVLRGPGAEREEGRR